MERYGLGFLTTAPSGTRAAASSASSPRSGGRSTARSSPSPSPASSASAVAIFLTQDFLDARLSQVFRTVIEMLAAIPSVVYGLWGIYVVIPALRPVAAWLHDVFGWFPLFSTSLSGPGMAPAVIVLAIMVLPTVAAISQDAFSLIPYKIKEAAYGLGTTRWEAIMKVMLPTASSGIFASLVLGFGRALGETMALAMLIGNSNQISLVAVLAGEHARLAPRLAVPRGRRRRGGGADVRRHRPAGDLARRERARHADHGASPRSRR